ncbi:MAG: signal peptidase II [Desulfobulbus propionicus]|nr:MAG: signal peptidase II [Desulfobulbus propionicus]
MQFLVTALLVICADQCTKYLVAEQMDLYESFAVVPGFCNLTFVTNNGAAFSLFAGQPGMWRQVFFISVVCIALVILVIAHRSYSRSHAMYAWAFGLIAGGAVGNLIDRIRLGHVVDFIDIYIGRFHWPAFNGADSAITGGVFLFLFINIFLEREQRKGTKH